MTRFDSITLHQDTHAAIEAMGFTEMTPVQEVAIPVALAGRDVLAQAQTGTGKTAAFGIPLIEASREGRRGLVLCPTRELAQQVQRELQAIGKQSPADVVCLIGGAPMHAQVTALKRHPNATIVATPGRIVDHLGRGTVDLSDIAVLVLDEADEMLSMGFADELDTILQSLPPRQTLLFTATLPTSVERLAARHLQKPETIRVGDQRATTSVQQRLMVLPMHRRADAIQRLVLATDPSGVLVFCRTRDRVTELAEALGADALHGGMNQAQRQGTLQRFRDQRIRILVATDVAARGLDVDHIDLVIHDDLPADAQTYVHRTGRTGRAGRTGDSIVMMPPQGVRRLAMIRNVAGHLERIEVPTSEDIAEAQADRLIEDLVELEPGTVAAAALERALAHGMSPNDVALRALDLLLTVPDTQDESKPNGTDETVAVAVKAGRIDQIGPGHLMAAFTRNAGLTAEDVGRIDILDRMSVVEVPAKDLERVIEALGSVKIGGQWLKPRQADDWRFKTVQR